MRRPSETVVRPVHQPLNGGMPTGPTIGKLISSTARLAREATELAQPVRLRNGEHPKLARRRGASFGLLV